MKETEKEGVCRFASGPDGFQPQFSEHPYNQSSFHKETRIIFLVKKKKKKDSMLTKNSSKHSHDSAYTDLELLI